MKTKTVKCCCKVRLHFEIRRDVSDLHRFCLRARRAARARASCASSPLLIICHMIAPPCVRFGSFSWFLQSTTFWSSSLFTPQWLSRRPKAKLSQSQICLLQETGLLFVLNKWKIPQMSVVSNVTLPNYIFHAFIYYTSIFFSHEGFAPQSEVHKSSPPCTPIGMGLCRHLQAQMLFSIGQWTNMN